MVSLFSSHHAQPRMSISDACKAHGQSDVACMPTFASNAFRCVPTRHARAEPSRLHRVSLSPRHTAMILAAFAIGSVNGLPQFTHTTEAVSPFVAVVAKTHGVAVIGMWL
jgi:hypothetical protein